MLEANLVPADGGQEGGNTGTGRKVSAGPERRAGYLSEHRHGAWIVL